MSKMACECGHIFDFTKDPTENEKWLLSQPFILEMAELLDEGKLSGDDFFSRCSAAALQVHSCPECGRVLIQAKLHSGMFDAYVKEDEKRARPSGQGSTAE